MPAPKKLPAKVPAKAVHNEAEGKQLLNSLAGVCGALNQPGTFAGMNQTPTISTTDTLWYNLRWYLISNYRNLLNELYVEHGIVQTLVDQPVDDAFAPGFNIKTGQLSPDEIEELETYIERNEVISTLMQGIKWGRLFGGGGVLILTDQKASTPLNIKSIGPDTPLEFRSVDMWELYFSQQNVNPAPEPGKYLGANQGEFYDYYGVQVHNSRVYRIEGKQAPSFIRPRLRGWGMSEVERVVRSLNQYLKNQDVVFALLDEAKVDVYKIEGFNAALMNQAGTNEIAQRIQMANFIKNFTNALTMDAGDEYEQKTMNFAGLGDMLLQIRQGLAADLKMPMTKLFGVSAAGFSSGEDDIENYNAMLNGEIRRKAKFKVVDMLQLCCQKLFGTVVDDLKIEWNSLRILNAKEEEEVKDSKFNRVMSGFSSGLVPAAEAKAAINKDALLPVELDESVEALPPVGGAGEFATDGGAGSAKGKAGKEAPTAA